MADKYLMPEGGFELRGSSIAADKLRRKIAGFAAELVAGGNLSRIGPHELRALTRMLSTAGGYCFNAVPPSQTRIEIDKDGVWWVCTQHKPQHRVLQARAGAR